MHPARYKACGGVCLQEQRLRPRTRPHTTSSCDTLSTRLSTRLCGRCDAAKRPACTPQRAIGLRRDWDDSMKAAHHHRSAASSDQVDDVHLCSRGAMAMVITIVTAGSLPTWCAARASCRVNESRPEAPAGRGASRELRATRAAGAVATGREAMVIQRHPAHRFC